MARVKIAAAFALCAPSYYNFLHKKEMVDDSSAS